MTGILTSFVDYINSHEDWLIGQILDYAQKYGYTKYTSTLKEAWRLSISGLSASFVTLLATKGEDVELGVDEDFSSDSATQFGIIEAKRHRERGISLTMFLGLMKYYHQSYQDLIRKSDFTVSEKKVFSNLVTRFFDRVEIAFCKTWSSSELDQLVAELRNRNRMMTNEKNKYLTIFESLSIAVVIIDGDGNIENMNLAASESFYNNAVAGSGYYAEHSMKKNFTREFPWLAKSYETFLIETSNQKNSEVHHTGRYFHISYSRSLDLSGKFAGSIAIIEDITGRKTMERELEKLAATDPLTGSKNRRSFLQLFKQELAIGKRDASPMALLMIDIDHFKNINDTYGHETGDAVLKRLVIETHRILRHSDILSRWGGEEFMILLPDTDKQQSAMVAERLRSDLSDIEIHTGPFSVRFSVSIGMSVVENGNETLSAIIKRVDRALYMAKAQGRNRVVML